MVLELFSKCLVDGRELLLISAETLEVDAKLVLINFLKCDLELNLGSKVSSVNDLALPLFAWHFIIKVVLLLIKYCYKCHKDIVRCTGWEELGISFVIHIKVSRLTWLLVLNKLLSNTVIVEKVHQSLILPSATGNSSFVFLFLPCLLTAILLTWIKFIVWMASLIELSLYLWIGRGWSLQPWMILNLNHVKPLSWVKCHNVFEQILKFARVICAKLFVGWPKSSRISNKLSVVWISLGFSLTKGISLRNHYKSDDSCCKKVNTWPCVWFTINNLRSHIVSGTKLCF